MRHSIAICLGVDQVVAAGRDYAQALSVAGCRLSGSLARDLWDELPAYNGEHEDGTLSWIRCTEEVVKAYGMHCDCAEVVCFVDPNPHRFWHHLVHHEEAWLDEYGFLVWKAEQREPIVKRGIQGIECVYGPERPIFDVRGRL